MQFPKHLFSQMIYVMAFPYKQVVSS